MYFHANRGQENSMERWGIHSFQKEFERGCGLNKSLGSLGPIQNTSESEDPNRKDTVKNIQSWEDCDNSSCSNHSFLREPFYSYRTSSYLTNLVTGEDPNRKDTVKNIQSWEDCDMYDPQYSSSWKNHIQSWEDCDMYDPQYSSTWKNHLHGCIESYLQSQIDSSDREGTKKYKHLWIQCENCYLLNYKKFFKTKMNLCEHCGYHVKMSSSDRIELLIDPGTWDPMDDDMVSLDPIQFDSDDSDLDLDSDDSDLDLDFLDLDSDDSDLHLDFDLDLDSDDSDLLDFDLELDKYFISYLDFNSYLDSDDSDLDLDSDDSDLDSDDSDLDLDFLDLDSDDSDLHLDFDLDLDSDDSDLDLLDFDLELDKNFNSYLDLEEEEEEGTYLERIDFYQRKTGLTEAVQTGIGQLNGIPVAIGVMDFQFIGGSMGSAVGEKITRLIEHATNKFLPLIIVCASGGARMQEGSLSLMQMAKISSALYEYQSKKRLFYVSILTSPTTGGVTASFGMLGDIIIAEPHAYIAFAGKRVIEETLKITVPEGSQETEYLFEKGLFDLIVPRNLLKSALSELFQLHALFPLNENSN
nr:acetyl-CoA carboxylase carboxyltransferase beta subunit [Evolvulus alsinoides]